MIVKNLLVTLIIAIVTISNIQAQVQFGAQNAIAGGDIVPNGARSVYATDLDGDGDMDVLSASCLDDKIAWYENDGQASFIFHVITTDADK